MEDLSILTVTSKIMRNIVEVFKGTALAQDYLLPRPITHEVIPLSEESYFCAQFKKLGKEITLQSKSIKNAT